MDRRRMSSLTLRVTSSITRSRSEPGRDLSRSRSKAAPAGGCDDGSRRAG